MTVPIAQFWPTSRTRPRSSNPDDAAGWLILDRSYRDFEKHENAAAAFDKASPIIQADPLALSEYADTLARISATGFSGEPGRLLERALVLDPREPFTLMIAGTAAFERGDYQSTITYWRQLLDQLPAGTEAAHAVANGIERAQQKNNGAMGC